MCRSGHHCLSLDLACVLAAVLLFSSSCSGAGVGAEGAFGVDNSTRLLRVAAASDLQSVFPELAAGFEERQQQKVKVEPIFSSSGNLFSQISNGAPFDLYLSADLRYAERLANDGRARKSDVFVYATGRLAVYATESSLLLESEGISVVSDPRIRRLAIAHPDHAPYGRAAVETLRNSGLYDQASSKLVVGESVMQAAQFVESGAADLGIVALSLVKGSKAKGKHWVVPKELHSPIVQGGAILAAEGPKASVARAFVDYLLGGEGQKLLQSYGFDPPHP
jgi:molybdate transport system substrate-binding protein